MHWKNDYCGAMLTEYYNFIYSIYIMHTTKHKFHSQVSHFMNFKI